MSWDARESPGLFRGGVINRTHLRHRLAVAGLTIAALATAQLGAPDTAAAVTAAPHEPAAAITEPALIAARVDAPASRAARRTAVVPHSIAAPRTPVVVRAQPAARKARPVVKKTRRAAPAAQRRVERPAQHRAARRAPAEQAAPRSAGRHKPRAAHRPSVKHKRVRAGRPSGAVGTVIAFARAQLGEPYRMGAAGSGAWDCSGLTMKAYAKVGVSLPHKAARQNGRSVSRGEARPGDLVKWGGYHVGIYLGDGQVIHAPKPGDYVKISGLWGSYRFVRIM